MRCPKCSSELEREDIEIKHINTWHKTWLYAAICKKCDTIIGFMAENVAGEHPK